MTDLTAWTNRSNTSLIAVYDDMDLEDLGAWNRAVLEITPAGGGASTTLDSDIDTTLIWINSSGVQARLGAAALGLAAGSYTADLDIYGLDHPNGYHLDGINITLNAATVLP